MGVEAAHRTDCDGDWLKWWELRISYGTWRPRRIPGCVCELTRGRVSV
jgi:hypothetical protein